MLLYYGAESQGPTPQGWMRLLTFINVLFASRYSKELRIRLI